METADFLSTAHGQVRQSGHDSRDPLELLAYDEGARWVPAQARPCEH